MKFFLTSTHQLPHMVSLKPGLTYKMEVVEGVYEPNRIPDVDYKHGDVLYVLSGDDGKIVRYTIIDTNPAPTVVPAQTPTSTPGDTPVTELGFSKRLLDIFLHGRRADSLPDAKILTLEEFSLYTERNLLRFLGFGKAALRETKEVLAKHGASLKPSTDLLAKSIDELDLPVRVANRLKAENIILIGQLVDRTENELRTGTNLNEKALDQIKAALALRELHPHAKR